MNLALPHFLCGNYNKKIIEDLKQGNSPYKYMYLKPTSLGNQRFL